MNIIGLVSKQSQNSEESLLLEFISKQYTGFLDLEIIKISDTMTEDNSSKVNQKISSANGVVFLLNQDNQVKSSAVQYVINNSTEEHFLLKNKPVLVISENTYNKESSESQLQLRAIVEAPTIGAYTFPGNDFFLGEIVEAIDKNGYVKNQKLTESLENSLMRYVNFAKHIGQLGKVEMKEVPTEDLYANEPIKTTIEGLDKSADDWFEQAITRVKPVDGETYVKLDRGILTVNQLNSFLKSMPMELTFMDASNQFLYYNYNQAGEDMLASTTPNQVGSPIGELHPKGGHGRVEMLIQQLRSGQMDSFPIHVPTHGPDKFVVHNYKAVKDKAGNYLGVNEFVLDLKPIIDWYLSQTNQELAGGKVDAVSSASTHS